MITEQDLQEAIAECQGQRNPNASTCIKLAAFYTIKRELFPEPEKGPEPFQGYSYSAGPEEQLVDYSATSEFSRLIDGRPAAEIWPVLDELVEAVQALLPRLYNSFMDKLR